MLAQKVHSWLKQLNAVLAFKILMALAALQWEYSENYGY